MNEVDEKVQDWLASGTTMVWVVNPKQKTVAVYHAQLMGMPLLVDPLYGQSEAFYLSEAKAHYSASRRHEERPLIRVLVDGMHDDSHRFRERPATKTRDRLFQYRGIESLVQNKRLRRQLHRAQLA